MRRRPRGVVQPASGHAGQRRTDQRPQYAPVRQPSEEQEERDGRQRGKERTPPAPAARGPREKTRDEDRVDSVVGTHVQGVDEEEAEAGEEEANSQERRRPSRAAPREPWRRFQQVSRGERRAREQEQQDLVSGLVWSERDRESLKGEEDDGSEQA